MNALAINAEMVEALVLGKHPKLEQELVQIARRGELKGIVTKPPRYSATTIQWFADCERKFYWPAVAGLDSPGSPAQGFGTRLHKIQENYLNNNELPPRTTAEGMLASIGLPLLPKHGTPGLYVEQPFEMIFEGLPVAITGTRDFGVDPIEKDAKGFLLGDHKTARSMNPMWRKTKAWLRDNIQANLYAFTKHAELHALGFTDLKVVDKQWIYYYKDEKQADKLRQVDTLDHVGEQFETVIRPLVAKMAAMVEAAPKISDVALPADRSVCDAYGGCPHRARCFGMGQRENENMGVLAGKFTKQAIVERVTTTGAGTAVNPPPPKPQAAPIVVPAELAAPTVVVPAEAPEASLAEEKPKRGRPKGQKPEERPAEAEAAAQVERVFAVSPRTPGYNPEHSYWLIYGARPTRGFAAAVIDVDQIVGVAQANATAASGKEHFRLEYGGHALLEAAFASFMEEAPLVGAICVPAEMSSAAKDVIGLLRAHAALVIE